MLEDTYGHSPIKKMFELADVYGVAYDEERAARKPVRLGIIGAGGVAASKHIPAIWRLKTIWEPVNLAALCRRNERSGRALAEMYGCRWYSHHQEMIAEEELDGILVLSPNDLHAEHGLACIEAGIPVLLEKPITCSLADSVRLCEAAESRDIPLMTVSNKRYSPPYRRAKIFVEEGPVVDPALFFGKFNLGYDYLDLLEAGTIHLFDLTRFFMGDVAEVNACGVNRYKRNREGYPLDNAAIQFRFKSGTVGSLLTSSAALSLKPWERIE